jgi:hypothetical protein
VCVGEMEKFPAQHTTLGFAVDDFALSLSLLYIHKVWCWATDEIRWKSLSILFSFVPSVTGMYSLFAHEMYRPQ